MENKAFYRKKRPIGQTRTVVANLGGGVNEYLPSIAIGDNQLADAVDYWSTDGVSLKNRIWPIDPYVYEDEEIWSVGVTSEYRMVTWNGSSSVNPRPLICHATTNKAYKIFSNNDATAANFYATPKTAGALSYYTPAGLYYVYWSTTEKFILVSSWTLGVVSVSLPSTTPPADMVVHMNRIFFLDQNNRLWWCKAGDYTTWYAEAPEGEYVTDDAGQWVVESSQRANRIISYNDALYIFCDHSIYAFTGYSYPTYAMQLIVDGYGTYPYEYRSLCSSAGRIFFTFNEKVYFWTGTSNPPVLISEPIVSGNEFLNGIASGVKPWDKDYPDYNRPYSVFADHRYLYWYPFENTFHSEVAGTGTYYMVPQRIGMFDLERQTWWKVSGFTDAFLFTPYAKAEGVVYYMLPGSEERQASWGISNYWTGSTYYAPYNAVYAAMGSGVGGYRYNFKTKAFNVAPSEGVVLTDIYFLVRTRTAYTSSDTPSYTNSTFDVKILDVDADYLYDTPDNTFIDADVYSNTSPMSQGPAPDYPSMEYKWVVLHVPLPQSLIPVWEDQWEEDLDYLETGNGLFMSYNTDWGNELNVKPGKTIQLQVTSYGDPKFEIHRMELKYRVKGTAT